MLSHRRGLHTRNVSSSRLYFVTVVGALMVLIGFFLPWVSVRPSEVASAFGRLLGEALGAGGGIGHMVESLEIEFSGWDLATGLTLQDFLPSHGLGELFIAVLASDPEGSQILDRRVTSPMFWLFLSPLLALLTISSLFLRGGRGRGTWVGVSGGIVFVLISLHIVLFYFGWKSTISENLEYRLAAVFSEIAMGSGAWLTIIGSTIWVVGAFVAHSPGRRRYGDTLPRRTLLRSSGGLSKKRQRSTLGRRRSLSLGTRGRRRKSFRRW